MFLPFHIFYSEHVLLTLKKRVLGNINPSFQGTSQNVCAFVVHAWDEDNYAKRLGQEGYKFKASLGYKSEFKIHLGILMRPYLKIKSKERPEDISEQ